MGIKKTTQQTNLARRRHLKTSAKFLSFALLFTEVEIAWGAKILGVRV